MSKCLNEVRILFFPATIPPTKDSKVLFFDCGELKVGSFFDGKFYCRGVICWPSSWGYAPKEPDV